MNVKIMEALEKIVLDKKLLKELSKLSGDEIFKFFQKHSDINFTREEFEKTLAEVFVSVFSENFDLDSFSNLSEEDLEMVVGGANFWKKAVAIPLTALSVIGIMPTGLKNLDFSPKAEAVFDRFFAKTDFNVRDPRRMDEIKEFLRNDPYYFAPARGLNAGILADEGLFDAWWAIHVNRDHGQDQSDANQGLLNLLGAMRQTMQGGQPGEGQHHNVQTHEWSAADRLLNAYLNITLRENGVTYPAVNQDVVNLFKVQEFQRMLNDHFGSFHVKEMESTMFGFGSAPTGNIVEVRGFDRLSILAEKRGKAQSNVERTAFMNTVTENSGKLMLSGTLFFATGSLEKMKSLLGSAGMWLHAGAIKAYNRFIYNRLTLEKDPVKLKELMSEFLKSSVLRQDEAMDKIVEIMSGMADLWNESDRTGVPCTSACTMTFLGDSGVGKTYAARMLSKALFKKDMQPWQFITSTSITGSSVSSKNKKDGDATQGEQLSPADQMFNEKSEIIRQLSLNNRVIIVVDEIDKIHKNDPNDTILERLRDARDTGKLLIRKGVNYDYIDVSRTVFVCISNELRECWGLPKIELTLPQAAARTDIDRDKSLVNRFEIVEFNYFNKDDYAFILTPQINELREEYFERYNMDIEITKELIESIGVAAEEKNKGVRGVNDYLVLLRGKLVDYRSRNKIKENKNPGDTSGSVRKIKAVFDKKRNTFELPANNAVSVY